MKFRPLFEPKPFDDNPEFCYLDEGNGKFRKLSQQKLNLLSEELREKIFKRSVLTSSGYTPSCTFSFEFDGRSYKPLSGKSWRTNQDGMKRLLENHRIFVLGSNPYFKQFYSDFPYMHLENSWHDTAAGYSDTKLYVVQTHEKVIQRCLLMTTDPGDLIFDPTCVRKGTRVWAPLNPPVNGGTSSVSANEGASPVSANERTSSISVDDGASLAVNERTSLAPGKPTPSPLTGRAGVGLTGRAGLGLIPIESIQPGDFVLSHDGKAHRVLRTIRKPYRGTMVCIQHSSSTQTLWVTEDHRILCQKRTRSYGAERTWYHVPKEHFERARTLRREMTPAERQLWSALRAEQLSVKFRKQHPIGPYITDFYSWEAGLVIEVDGGNHFTPEAQEYDHDRDAYLTALGLTVLRFTNQEVAHQKEGVLDKIVETLRQVEPSEDHYKQWRRADSLQVGDVVYFGPEQRPVEITGLFIEQTEEEVYDLEVEGVHSFLAEVCAVHNCGSGTTAYVAEQWGRRWITCDTSRVALALARQRLLTATYPYYKLTDETRGVAGGFIYQTVPHITLKSIAQIEPPQTETLFDQPEEDKKKVRVPGPFTVEAIPPPSQEVMEGSPIGGAPEALERTDSEDDKGRTTHIGTLIELLRKDGVTFPNNQKMMFASFTARSGGVLHAEGEPGPPPPNPPVDGGEWGGGVKRVAVSFGPLHGPVTSRQVEDGIREANLGGFDAVIFCGFSFDGTAQNLIDKALHPHVKVFMAHIRPDVLMGDLLKDTASSQLFTVFGEPDIEVWKPSRQREDMWNPPMRINLRQSSQP